MHDGRSEMECFTPGYDEKVKRNALPLCMMGEVEWNALLLGKRGCTFAGTCKAETCLYNRTVSPELSLLAHIPFISRKAHTQI